MKYFANGILAIAMLSWAGLAHSQTSAGTFSCLSTAADLQVLSTSHPNATNYWWQRLGVLTDTTLGWRNTLLAAYIASPHVYADARRNGSQTLENNNVIKKVFGPSVRVTVDRPSVWYSGPGAPSSTPWISHQNNARQPYTGSPAQVTNLPAFSDYKVSFKLQAGSAKYFTLNMDFFADNSVVEVFVNEQAQRAAYSGGWPHDGADPFYFAGFTSGNRASLKLDKNWVDGDNSLVVRVASHVPQQGFRAEIAAGSVCPGKPPAAVPAMGGPGLGLSALMMALGVGPYLRRRSRSKALGR